MIGSLRGEVLERWSDSTVLIDVNGVGYLVNVTPRTLAELEPTSTAFLYIHHHITESDETLFGFLTRAEVSVFITLISSHRVGPTLGLAVLATYPPAALVDAVAAGDVAALTAVPGVGRKTAERLLVELRDRLAVPVLDDDGAAGGASSVASAVREALGGLGYSPEEVRDALSELGAVVTDATDASVALREALKLLGAKRA